MLDKTCAIIIKVALPYVKLVNFSYNDAYSTFLHDSHILILCYEFEIHVNHHSSLPPSTKVMCYILVHKKSYGFSKINPLSLFQ